MKNLITSLAVLITAFGFSQSKINNERMVNKEVRVENVSVVVTVDSAAEIESSFKVEDIKEIINLSDDNETLSFKIICNVDHTENGVKSHVSYKIEGNSNTSEKFLNGVEFIRNAAIKYYQNKE